MLAVLNKDQIAHAMFPLGDTPKIEVREEARSRGLLVADKPDSHDVCFIADGDTRGFLARKLGARPGTIVDADGAVLGATRAPTASPSASARACTWTARPRTASPATCCPSSRCPTP